MDDSPEMDLSVSVHEGYRGEGMDTGKEEGLHDKEGGMQQCAIHIGWVLTFLSPMKVIMRRKKMRRFLLISGRRRVGLSSGVY